MTAGNSRVKLKIGADGVEVEVENEKGEICEKKAKELIEYGLNLLNTPQEQPRRQQEYIPDTLPPLQPPQQNTTGWVRSRQ